MGMDKRRFEISFATPEDIPRIIEIIKSYADTHDEKYHIPILEQHLSDLISSPDAIILTSVATEGEYIITGFIAVALMSNPVFSEKIAYKLHWVVDKSYPSYAIPLLRAAERWAKLHNAAKLIISVRDDGGKTIMKRMRYSFKSTIFEKDMTSWV
jgi:hypothetical protein